MHPCAFLQIRFFSQLISLVANAVNKSREVFDERRWATPQQRLFSLTLTTSVMDSGNSSCQMLSMCRSLPLGHWPNLLVWFKWSYVLFCEYFNDHSHPARKDIRTASNQRSCLKQWKITVSGTHLYHEKLHLAMV